MFRELSTLVSSNFPLFLPCLTDEAFHLPIHRAHHLEKFLVGRVLPELFAGSDVPVSVEGNISEVRVGGGNKQRDEELSKRKANFSALRISVWRVETSVAHARQRVCPLIHLGESPSTSNTRPQGKSCWDYLGARPSCSGGARERTQHDK